MAQVRNLTLLGALTALAAAQSATAAITVATNATAPALRVDAQGRVEVSWMSRGRKATALVPISGPVRSGGTLAPGDVSQPVRGTHIPFQRVLRVGPGGWYYAVQSWRVRANGPIELRVSRWRGVPTEVSVISKKVARGVKLTGRVTLNEEPVRQGFVFLDALRGKRWERLGRANIESDASYSRVFRPSADLYRATVLGPNVGETYAPDASAVVGPPIAPDPPPRRGH